MEKARIDLFANPVSGKLMKHFIAMHRILSDSPLPATIQHLVTLRASQINGCSVCTDMHAKDALHGGDTFDRINLVAAWREASVFTDAERAALELAEQSTRIADAAGGVSDEVWANAAKYYDEDQLASLVCLLSLINAANRLNVIVQQPVGNYQPGQLH